MFLISSFVFFSCGKTVDNEQEVVKPVKISIAQSSSSLTKDYVGVVESDQVTNLAFKVSGQIINLAVKEGDRVKKGQLIAEIDTRDFILQYEVNKSAYVTAKAQYERFQRLLAKEAVSQQDFEIAETNYEKAKASLENSQNILDDAHLKAPFDGTIEQKKVENFQRVNVGEAIVRLVNTGDLYVKFNMADYNLGILKTGSPVFSVRFNNLSTTFFPARLREYTDISTDGSGLPVSLWVDDAMFKNGTTIKPGFACDVRVVFNFGDSKKSSVMIPISAVFVDTKTGENCVWVVENNELDLRRVTLGSLKERDQNIVFTINRTYAYEKI